MDNARIRKPIGRKFGVSMTCGRDGQRYCTSVGKGKLLSLCMAQEGFEMEEESLWTAGFSLGENNGPAETTGGGMGKKHKSIGLSRSATRAGVSGTDWGVGTNEVRQSSRMNTEASNCSFPSFHPFPSCFCDPKC